MVGPAMDSVKEPVERSGGGRLIASHCNWEKVRA